MKNKWFYGLLLMVCGCAGWERDCSSGCASSLGSDWIVLQYGYDGKPINCWKLHNTAISNETGTDGIYWQSPEGNLVHISGWYNRVQVNKDFGSAAKQLGIDLNMCAEGAYRSAAIIHLPEHTITDK